MADERSKSIVFARGEDAELPPALRKFLDEFGDFCRKHKALLVGECIFEVAHDGYMYGLKVGGHISNNEH